MVPRIFLKNATDADRIFLRKWKYGVAVVYGALALAVVIVGLGTMGTKNSLQADGAPTHNHALNR
jgi:glucose uptake protein GlcU